ncbi:hypothetical protein Q4Q34_07810 [Flavivirga abyssicola]|uniref:hypothetical protein n=1 Tax=Flavivirga abyssicola TaxID=3063533 RepID=UPI0026E029C7|nr:hypothetical protein [Flavivirga sp. MEBiC07777]WVK14931.1 hypothetical protein Q4Q34_07810 [Flavivirga sp. MEBiC07777]
MMFLKLKAGALQLTMFVVVVIALLLAVFIILIHTHKTFKIQTDFILETVNNTDKGINYALQNTFQLNDTISVNLNDENYKTLKIHRDYWGLFEKVTTVSNIKTNSFKKTALVGAAQQEINRTALYIEDNNRPLVLVGNTKIKGVAYIPKQGIRTGNISGHSYYGEHLIYGKEKTSTKLPELLPEIHQQIKTIASLYKGLDKDQFLDLSRSRIQQNSFYKPLQIIYDPLTINLSEVSLTGYILVQSETKIIVDASSNLKDVVLIAPKIELRNHVEGGFQAFATKEITVGKNCKLQYPSALVLKEINNTTKIVDNTKETPLIKIKKGSKIKGIITYLGSIKNYKSQVFIDENVTITGEVYCDRNLELLGKVYGSVYTSGFVANQSGSVYQNHIYNGTIDIDNLPQEYIGLPFKNAKKGIAKWLY